MNRFSLLVALLVIPFFVAPLAAQVKPGAKSSAASGDPFALWPAEDAAMTGVPAELQPTLTPYLPDPANATGAAFIVCPGGGYAGLAPHEGEPVALWLRANGIASFVLKYRHSPKFAHPVPLGDAQRAIRTIRAHATEWKIDPTRIGILGFSAGGHLTASAGTHYDAGNANSGDPIERVSCRPDALVLVYPVITMGEKTHAGSKKNLLGENPDPKLVELMSNEKQVTNDTPPTFLIHGVNDTAVDSDNSTMFADALKRTGVPFEYHLFEDGPHGFGLGEKFQHLKGWPAMCANWLRAHKFASDPAPSKP